MPNIHEGCSRAFIQYSKAWYAQENTRQEALKEEVMFGFYDLVDGGTSGEMAVRWYVIGGELTARLEVYCDAWDALACFSDVIAKMAKWNDKSPQPEDFIQILLECGFTDRTPKHYAEDFSAR